MVTLVACKRTNQYCTDTAELSNKDILYNICVKNKFDEFSKLTYIDLIQYFKDSEVLDLMIQDLRVFYRLKPTTVVNIEKIPKPLQQFIARHLRYHLRGLSEEQTMYKFNTELYDKESFIRRNKK